MYEDKAKIAKEKALEFCFKKLSSEKITYAKQ